MSKPVKAKTEDVKKELAVILERVATMMKQTNLKGTVYHKLNERKMWNVDYFIHEYLAIQQGESKVHEAVREIIVTTVVEAISRANENTNPANRANVNENKNELKTN